MSNEPELSPEARQAITDWDTMPQDLVKLLEDHIEPFTVTFQLEHSDVMEIFKATWPLMRRWMVNNILDQIEQMDLDED